MQRSEPQTISLPAKLAWPLLVLTSALQVYLGLSAVAYLFMGVPEGASVLVRSFAAAAGALQVGAAGLAFGLAGRRDLRGTTLGVAASVLLGWVSTLPGVLAQGLDFGGDDLVSPALFVLSPLVAIVAAGLAWRNAYPVAAALVVSGLTVAGLLVVIAFSIVIAVHGF
jgi:hypothetical protein